MTRKIWTTRRPDHDIVAASPLTLTTETLHNLHDTDLARVVGGTKSLARTTTSPR